MKAKSGGKKHVPGTMGQAAPFAAAGDARAMELYMVSIRGSMRKLPRVVTHTKPTRKLEPRGYGKRRKSIDDPWSKEPRAKNLIRLKREAQSENQDTAEDEHVV